MKLPRLVLEDNEDGTFTLQLPFRYETKVGGSCVIAIPAGETTDLASIPFFGRWLISSSGKYNKAAVVHDYIYKTNGYHGRFTRKQADEVMAEIMEKLGVKTYASRTINLGLKVWTSLNPKYK